MLSSVLNSERAIQIIDAFIAMRRYALAAKPQDVTRRIAILEKVLLQYMGKTDRRIDEIVETLNEMLSADETDLPEQIGFIKD